MPLALSVAREHCDWCALQGLTPAETLRAVGIQPSLIQRIRGPSWGYVEGEIAARWVALRGELTDKSGEYRRAA